MLSGASKSSKLRGSMDGLDELDGMDVVSGITPQAGHQRLTIVNVAVLAFDALPDGSVAVSMRR